MSAPYGERRRRRDAERALEQAQVETIERLAGEGAVADSVPQQRTAGVEPQDAARVSPQPTALRDDRPLSRRELRERERGRAADAPSAGPGTAAAPVPVPPTPEDVVRAPEEHDLDPVEPRPYSWKHCVALGAVAGVLGFLVWSLTTDGGAGVAASSDLTTTLSAVPAVPRGEA